MEWRRSHHVVRTCKYNLWSAKELLNEIFLGFWSMVNFLSFVSTMSDSLFDTLGAASIGFNLACCLFGVLTTQVFIYFKRFSFDKPVYKLLVCHCSVLAPNVFDSYMEGFYTLVNCLPYQTIQCSSRTDTMQDAGVTGSCAYWIPRILLHHKVRFRRIFYSAAEHVLQTRRPKAVQLLSVWRQSSLVSLKISPFKRLLSNAQGIPCEHFGYYLALRIWPHTDSSSHR